MYWTRTCIQKVDDHGRIEHFERELFSNSRNKLAAYTEMIMQAAESYQSSLTQSL